MANRKVDVLTKCESATDLISQGLSMLEECALEGLSGARYIDVTARLNTQAAAIEKIVKPLKDAIKSKALEDHAGSNQDLFVEKGVVYQANIKRVTKTVVIMEKVKEKLGRLLPQFQEQREEIQVSFSVKE